MGRFSDTLMDPRAAFARGQTAPMLNPLRGGQMGWAPNYTEWINNQQYIRNNIICVLLEAPTGFLSLPNPEYYVGTLRAIMELHAIRITGLNATLTVETTETPFGAGGNMQEDPTKVTRAPSNVSIELNEKYGMPFSNFFSNWIRHLIRDPDSQYATVNTLSGTARVTDMLADRYSMTCAFFEPDPSHTRVLKAWIGTGMYPKTSGEIIGTRDITAGGEASNYTIDFAGIYQTGLGVNNACQALLEAMDITGASPYAMAPFISEIAADVKATNVGYASNIADTARGAVAI